MLTKKTHLLTQSEMAIILSNQKYQYVLQKNLFCFRLNSVRILLLFLIVNSTFLFFKFYRFS